MSESTIEQARIERDLEGTRSRLNQGLNELQEKVAPRELAGDFVDYVRQGGGTEFARNLMASVRRNPVPVVLVGVGLLWLMASQAPVSDSTGAPARGQGQWRSGKPNGEAEGQAGRFGETEVPQPGRMGRAQDKAVEMGRQVQGAAAGIADQEQSAAAAGQQSFARGVDDLQAELADRAGQLSDMAQRAGGKLQQGAQSARQRGGTLVASIIDNPLVLGAMGLSVGAFLGLLVPKSEWEETALGDVASDAQETVQGMMDRAGRVVAETADQLRARSRTQGVDTGRSADDRADDAQSGAARYAEAGAQGGPEMGKGASEVDAQPDAASRDS
ncbi:MAG TPA: DUF3618 domain-containing protein [Acidocella sp.]|jgi:hypothetical protein|nr:DUF3618 domain-containing protein [Acidocella sp.]